MPYDNIVVDNITTIKTAVWHAGDVVPGWNTANETPDGDWTFTNNNFTAETT